MKRFLKVEYHTLQVKQKIFLLCLQQIKNKEPDVKKTQKFRKLKLVITKMLVSTSELETSDRRPKKLLLQRWCFAQVSRDRRSKRSWSDCVLCIPFILSGSPNEFWLHMCQTCVRAPWRLRLQAPLVAFDMTKTKPRRTFHPHAGYLPSCMICDVDCLQAKEHLQSKSWYFQ